MVGPGSGRRSNVTALLAAAAVAGCALAPAASPGPYWTRIDPAAIEQPPEFMVHHDAGPTEVTACAPCHPAVDTTMTGIAGGPAGFVAVGWIFQGFHGVAWHSADGHSWTLDTALPENSVLAAVAADATRYVAVGGSGQGATVWTSTDGLAWQRTASTAFGATPLRLTSVIHWAGGFVAGGYEGTEFASATPAFWFSPDGLTWQQAPESTDLHDARVNAIAEAPAGSSGLVAVGTTGPASDPGPAIVWTSADGRQWHRVPNAPVFAGARMRTVVGVPGIGFLAAGEELAGDIGAVWTSRDGTGWTRVPTQPAFGRHGIQVRMVAVSAGGPGGHGATIVGTATEGMQYGEGVAWTSPDGVAWTRQPWGAEFADSELSAVTTAGSLLYAVGDRGAPDTYVATIWTSPPGWTSPSG